VVTGDVVEDTGGIGVVTRNVVLVTRGEIVVASTVDVVS